MTVDYEKWLDKAEFPRSSRYDRDWMLENQMGPNAIWLMEWLCEELKLEPGMRVLDLGCGRAMTSIFLAREFGVQVYAADLWISPEHNWQRIMAAGQADRVCPLRSEAHALPFASGFFDAVVSADAWQYFGTDVLYLPYLARFVRPEGQIGMVVPGLMQPFADQVPEHLLRPQANGSVFWEDECVSFKTADWWRELWQSTNRVTDVRTAAQPEGWRHWRDFERAVEASGKGLFPSVAESLERDSGRYIGFVRAAARRSSTRGENLYDPAIGLQAGADR